MQLDVICIEKESEKKVNEKNFKPIRFVLFNSFIYLWADSILWSSFWWY